MANLFWKTTTGTKSLLAKPFITEEEFEKIVFETSELLEEIFLLKRQIRGGNKTGVPDIVGVDNDGNVCIIEMKNITVDSSIIPQVLQYAFWAESNPDSIKSLWLEKENRPDDLTMSWEDIQVRILVIAPEILPSTLHIVDKINYPVDLIEVKRWVDGDNNLLLVTKLEPEVKPKPKPVSGFSCYNEEFYLNNYNPNSAKEFLKYAQQLELLVKQHGWKLETKFNKHYCGFKAGFFNAFGIQFVGSKTFAFFIKLPRSEAEKAKIKFTRYEENWNQAVYYIEPGKTQTADYLLLFEMAYRHLTGN